MTTDLSRRRQSQGGRRPRGFHPERGRRERALMLPTLADEENLRLRFDVPTKTTASGRPGTRRPTSGSSGWSQ